jgi:hypothetical protein
LTNLRSLGLPVRPARLPFGLGRIAFPGEVGETGDPAKDLELGLGDSAR